MTAYGLEKCKCLKCGIIKLHELYYDAEQNKDFKKCLKCDEMTEYKEADCETKNH